MHIYISNFINWIVKRINPARSGYKKLWCHKRVKQNWEQKYHNAWQWGSVSVTGIISTALPHNGGSSSEDNAKVTATALRIECSLIICLWWSIMSAWLQLTHSILIPRFPAKMEMSAYLILFNFAIFDTILNEHWRKDHLE